MAIKTVTIEPNVTLSAWKDLGGGPGYDWDFASASHNIPIGYEAAGNHSYGSYEWTFTGAWKTGAGVGTVVSVTEAYLEFYYQRGDNPLFLPSFEIVNLGSSAHGAVNAQAAWDLIDGAATTVATVTTARGDKKNLIRVGIVDLSNLATAIDTPGGYFLGLRRTDTTRDTLVELGGSTLLSGIGTGWSAAAADEVIGYPKLVITFTEADVTHVQHEARYTTADPTTTQDTPSNSLGGYFASNEIFTSARIGDFVSSAQTTVKIDSGSSLPSATGIAQLGPEVISFTGIDTDNSQLTGVTRGVAPSASASFPAEVDQFLEYIRYLVVDNLFDRKPSTDLVQYRCVAVVQASAAVLNNVTISLVQDDDADVQIDVGIEVPAFDATDGTFQKAVDSGAVTFDSGSAAVRNKATGFYDGGHIVIDPSGTPFQAIIESYDDDGAKATFILDTAMTGYILGTDFRINPAPAQAVNNERTAPTTNSNRFFGFLGDGGSNQIGYLALRENVGTLNQNDAFYLWIKRTLARNQKSTPSTGAIVIIEGTQ